VGRSGGIETPKLAIAGPRMSKAPAPMRSIQEAPSDLAHAEQRRAKRLRVLLWCDYRPGTAATISDHINAIYTLSQHEVFVYPRVGPMPEELDLDAFDCIIVHYSLALALPSYVTLRDRRRLAASRARKAAFIQDEYRFFRQTREVVIECGIDRVFTCLEPEDLGRVYGEAVVERVSFTRVLTGYVSKWLLAEEPIPLVRRSIDVGYRGRDYSAWLGSSAQEKTEIGRRFKEDPRARSLRLDVAWQEKERLYGYRWMRFQQRCRAVLSTETAIGRLDPDGSVAAKVETFERLASRQDRRGKLRKPSYSAVQARFFGGDEPPSTSMQLSPRTIEAASLRTGLIMYEGSYSGFFEPWVHYLPLKKDHSNTSDVIHALRDDNRLAEVIANAYGQVASAKGLDPATMVREVDDWISIGVPVADRVAHGLDLADFHQQHGFLFISNPHGLDGEPGVDALVARMARRLARLF